MHWLWVLIVGAIIGAIAGAITHHSGAMGRISNIIAGLVGSALGEALLGHWGPQLAGMAIIPSLIGAIVVVAVVSFFLMRSSAKNWGLRFHRGPQPPTLSHCLRKKRHLHSLYVPNYASWNLWKLHKAARSNIICVKRDS